MKWITRERPKIVRWGGRVAYVAAQPFEPALLRAAAKVGRWTGCSTAPGDPPGERVVVQVREGPQRYTVGGTCGAGPIQCQVSQRARASATTRALRLGFRLTREIG